MLRKIQQFIKRRRGRAELRRTIKYMRKSLKQYGKSAQITEL